MNQIYQTRSIQSYLQNLIQETNSTKQNLEKANLQKIEVKFNPSWAELGPDQPQLVLYDFLLNLAQPRDFVSFCLYPWPSESNKDNRCHDFCQKF